MTIEERFWSKVDKSGDHWMWKGSGSKGNQYGNFIFRGRPQNAHRVAWILTNGEIPDGMEVCHKCDVKLCVRHLFLGTHQDNMLDARNKVRMGGQKLSWENVLAIRNRYHTDPYMSMTKLANEYGVAKSTIRNAVRGKQQWSQPGPDSGSISSESIPE